MNLLNGRSALVTGASRGLGAEIARTFVKKGASLFLCARNQAPLDEICEELNGLVVSENQKIVAQTCDVSVTASVDELILAATSEFPELDILVNNAGVYGPMGSIESVDWDAWVDAIRINLLGTVYPSRALIKHFRRIGGGKIINISGGGATSPLPGISAYAASKAAVVRFTETMAMENLDFNIDVNAVAPGSLATRLMDSVVDAGPEKVGAAFHERMVKTRAEGGTSLSIPASLCVYLASHESDGITGKLIAAVWDPWANLAQFKELLCTTDIYNLRRIIPEDRGQDWEHTY